MAILHNNHSLNPRAVVQSDGKLPVGPGVTGRISRGEVPGSHREGPEAGRRTIMGRTAPDAGESGHPGGPLLPAPDLPGFPGPLFHEARKELWCQAREVIFPGDLRQVSGTVPPSGTSGAGILSDSRSAGPERMGSSGSAVSPWNPENLWLRLADEDRTRCPGGRPRSKHAWILWESQNLYGIQGKGWSFSWK